jgi:hypothetical protein
MRDEDNKSSSKNFNVFFIFLDMKDVIYLLIYYNSSRFCKERRERAVRCSEHRTPARLSLFTMHMQKQRYSRYMFCPHLIWKLEQLAMVYICAYIYTQEDWRRMAV